MNQIQNATHKSSDKYMDVGCAQNVRLRSANRGNANNTWNVNASGNVNNNNAVNSNRFAPDCADKWTRSHAVAVVSANDRRKEPKSMPGNR